VRDKDGISAAVLVCDLVAALGQLGRSVPDALDELARVYGVHEVAAMSRPVADADDDAGLMERLRMAPPGELAGSAAIFTDIVDALIFTGGDGDTWARVVVRPSGTEPKVKCYLEVGCAIADDLAAARERARTVLERLVSEVRDW
jgi:phosphomannomutase